MSRFWGASRAARERLLVTLRSLGPTSVQGLSAALSWSERKTERTIREISTRHEAALEFDPGERSIAFAVPRGRRPVTPVVEGSIPPDGSAPPAPAAPSPHPPSPVARSVGPTGNCDVCGVRMLPTGTGLTVYCPECGRLANIRRPGALLPPGGLPAPARPAPAVAAQAERRAGPNPPNANDRRAQEMFAAWVTSQPIPCPRCRTALRHRGVAEYSCPTCGEHVHFGGPTLPTSPVRPAAAAPLPP